MGDLGPVLEQLLDSYGPAALFIMAVLETSFVTGLVVPAGAAAAFAAAASVDDPTGLAGIAVATTAGGWVGDWIGYRVGRRAGPALLERKGWSGAALRRHQAGTARFLGRHPVYSVTVARLVSFVRTLMPMSAGMSGIRPVTFLVYELPGVILWAALYIGVGILAGESWQLASSMMGAGWLVLFAVAGAVLWLRARIRSRGRS